MSQAIQGFIDAIRAAGLQPPDSIIDDGKLYRFSSNGDARKKNGWYRFYSDFPQGGVFGCNKLGISEKWFTHSGAEHNLTPSELAAIKARQEQAKAQREADRATMHKEKAKTAKWIWDQCEPATEHPYLAAKGIKPSGARVTKPSEKYPEPSLVVPVVHLLPDGKTEFISLQFIRADGSKNFMGGGELVGGCFTISGESDTTEKLVICEGFATGATIQEATNTDVAVAFNAGNLKPVADAMRKLFPEVQIIVAADDDWKTSENPGIAKAIEAAEAVNGLVAIPDFGSLARGEKDTDFNDLAALCRAEGAPGGEFIKHCFESALTPEMAKEALSRIDGLTIQELVNRALTDIKTLFKPSVLKALSGWKKSQAGLYTEFKQALKTADLKVIRDIEAAMKGDGKGQEAKQTEGRDSNKNEGRRARPRVESGVDIAEMVDTMQNALIGANVQIFVRAGTLCRLTHGSKNQDLVKREASAPVVALAPTAHLMELASTYIEWFETKEKAGQIIVTDCLPPRIAVDALVARGTWDFPELRGVISAPTIRHDGSLLSAPGYDKASGLFFEPGTTVFPEMPENPTLQDAKAAIAELLEVFADFPFLEPCDRAAALAFLLTLLCRHAIDGCTPMFLVRASTAGTGKSLLVDAISIIATGRKAARFAQEDSDEESRKRLFAIAIAGDPLVLIDNIDKPLGSAALDAAITAGTIRDRILGKSETVSAPWTAVLAGTGNNVSVRGDLARRVVPIDLNANMEKPEERENFKHGDLLAWCKSERGRLVAAGLTVLRGFIVAGKPRQGIAQYGSFEQWSGLVRESLVWCGSTDPAAGRSRIRDTSDPALADLREALHSWRAAFGSKALSIAEVVGEIERSFAPNFGGHAQHDTMKALKEALGAFDHRFDGKRINPRATARALSKHKNRIVDGHFFQQRGVAHGGAALWSVSHHSDNFGDSGDSGDSRHHPRGEKSHKEESDHTAHNNKSSIYGFHMEGAGTESPESPKSPEPPDAEEWGDA